MMMLGIDKTVIFVVVNWLITFSYALTYYEIMDLMAHPGAG